MMNLLRRLMDPRTQLFLVGLLTVVAGVCEYLLSSEFIQGYPEIVGVVAAISAVIVGALRIAKSIFLGQGSSRK